MLATTPGDWAPLVMAIGSVIAGVVAAVFAGFASLRAGRVVKAVRMPSNGKAIGQAVEETQQVATALVNEYSDLREHHPAFDRRQQPQPPPPPPPPPPPGPTT